MTPRLADEFEFLNQRLKEIEEAKEKARNTDHSDTEKPKEAENHEWSFSIDNVYPG